MTWNSDEFTDLFENAPIGIHWVGPDGIVLHVNRAGLELMDYTREDNPLEPAELIAIIASLTGRLAFTSDPHAKGHA